MNKIVLTSLATLAMATSAMAKIGQTPQEVIQDAQREKAVNVQWIEYLGKRLLQVTYHDDFVCHQFGADGRENAFYYFAGKGLKPQDVDKFQRRYHTAWHGTGTDGGLYSWESANGLSMLAERCEGFDMLIIFDSNRTQEIHEIRKALPAPPAWARAPVTPDPNPFAPPAPAPTLSPRVARPAPIAPSNPPRVARRTANDCYVIASQIYANLKTSCHWVKVANITIREKSTAEVSGHAVVFSQLTPSSNIIMSDENGGLDLQTKSHDLQEITDAAAYISAKLPTAPYIVQSAKWIDETSPSVEVTPHKSSTTSSTATEQTTEQTITMALAIIGMTAVGLFARYAGVRLWPFAILSEPIYLMIQAIRNQKRT